jgi:hypothetical protein
VINRTVNKSLEILQKELLKNNENSFVRWEKYS